MQLTDDLLEDEHFLKLLKKHPGSIALITDEKVASLYGESLLEELFSQEISCTLISFPGGEKNKNRRTKEKIEDALFEKGFGRDTLLIVMGGGVVTDIGGFVASTYCRGIPYISLPTTLLGMVDASIGGKTGVNVKQGKNLIGTFYPPVEIFADLSTLNTLPDPEMLSGSAEVIKYGLISERSILSTLEENIEKWKQRDLPLLKKVIHECAHIKKKVVESDQKEEGKRRILNFGHTVGHAIETLEEYTLSHGEAIAIGMIVETLISQKMGFIKEGDTDAIHSLFKEIGFPLTLTSKVTTQEMKKVMSHDKKGEGGLPRFVLLEKIGRVAPFKGSFCTHVDEEILDEALGWMIAECVR
ncbi:MAG: 3-dehydroquinate synthase [Chlamydiia bacterium]|nr:3-dehydroquinate synthase [Chlamydiia bacterium]